MRHKCEGPPVAAGGPQNLEPSSSVTQLSGQGQAVALLTGWHGSGQWPGWVTIWAKAGPKTSTSFARNAKDGIREISRLLAAPEHWNIYFSLCQLGCRPSSGRGTAADVAFLPGVWMEVDVQGAGHASENLCPSFSEAKQLISKFPKAPSFVVNSGGGIHAYWDFPEPVEIRTEEERREARALVRNFQDYFRRPSVNPAGYLVDKVDDLARVLRVPGTSNFKKADSIRPVCLEQTEGLAA